MNKTAKKTPLKKRSFKKRSFKKKPAVKTLKNKLDKLYQQWGHRTYGFCILCGSPMSCLHHFIHKQQCTGLRWDKKNGVPVCMSCHCRIHSRNDPADIFKMSSAMCKFHGADWLEYIDSVRVAWVGSKLTRKYCEDVENQFKELLNG